MDTLLVCSSGPKFLLAHGTLLTFNIWIILRFVDPKGMGPLMQTIAPIPDPVEPKRDSSPAMRGRRRWCWDCRCEHRVCAGSSRCADGPLREGNRGGRAIQPQFGVGA